MSFSSSSSPELSFSPASDSMKVSQKSSQKRRKRTDFSGLSEDEKAVAKKANNRQAAQNLRDRKRQQEQTLEEKLQSIEDSNNRLAAQLAGLEADNKAMQDEARALANEHIQKFQLQGLASRLMGAVQRDPGSGQSISALLEAMGKALDVSASSPGSQVGASSAVSPASSASTQMSGVSDDDSIMSAPLLVPESPSSSSFDCFNNDMSGIASMSGLGEDPADDRAAPSPSTLLNDLPEVSMDVLDALLPTTPIVDVAPKSVLDTSFTLSLPVLSQESVSSALANEPNAKMTRHSAPAVAWPAVPPLPSGLQQLLMAIILASLTRLAPSPHSSVEARPSPSTCPTSTPDCLALPLTTTRSMSPLETFSKSPQRFNVQECCRRAVACNKEWGLVQASPSQPCC